MVIRDENARWRRLFLCCIHGSKWDLEGPATIQISPEKGLEFTAIEEP
jgi:hypothetical protein